MVFRGESSCPRGSWQGVGVRIRCETYNMEFHKALFLDRYYFLNSSSIFCFVTFEDDTNILFSFKNLLELIVTLNSEYFILVQMQ